MGRRFTIRKDGIKAWFAQRLRWWADRIDYENAFVACAANFKMVRGKGMVIEQTEGIQVSPGPEGVQLWYINSEYAAKREGFFSGSN